MVNDVKPSRIKKLIHKLDMFWQSKYKVYFIIHELNKIPRKFYWKRLISFVENSSWQFSINKDRENSNHILISLTTYPERYPAVIKTLKSLSLQTMKPDKIVVSIFEDDKISPELKELEKYGIEFNIVSENLKPHNKYFYTMQKYSGYDVITVDDDCYYSQDLVSSLWNKHKEYPECVCARRVHKMLWDEQGKLKPYDSWAQDWSHTKEPSMNLLATGVSGVYYPAHILPVETFNAGNIKKRALLADDIWLKAMELKAAIPVVWVPSRMSAPPDVEGISRTGLYVNNVYGNRNDVIIHEIEKLYSGIWNETK